MPEVTDADLEVLDAQIDRLITAVTTYQGEVLSVHIAASFIAGTKSTQAESIKSAQDDEYKGLPELHKQTIRKLSAEYFGYISEFDRNMGEQLKDRAREIVKEKAGRAELYKEISKYTEDIFRGSESVVIDRRGQKRTIIEIGKDGKLKKAEKEITRKYVTNTQAYSEMLARTASHASYEDGRAAEYQEKGYRKWRFIGPVGERSRPSHSAVVGNAYEYGTPDSDMAQSLLHEPNCRHRSVVFWDDPDLDTDQALYDREKKKMGLQYDDEKGEWIFGDPAKTPKKYPNNHTDIPEIESPELKYTPAKTVKQAEKWLKENTDVKHIDFKDVKLDIVNEMNERLAHHLNLAPKIGEKMNYYGTGQAQFTLFYEARIKEFVENWKKLYPDEAGDALKRAKGAIKKKKMSAYAHSWDLKNYDFGGIAINKKFGGDPEMLIKSLQRDVSMAWHPVGCDTPKAIIDHEFGHMLDNVYHISKSNIVKDLYGKMDAREIKEGLSDYAKTNREEFVAEAWSEYLNNPNPRPVAKEIGDYVMKMIEEDT